MPTKERNTRCAKRLLPNATNSSSSEPVTSKTGMSIKNVFEIRGATSTVNTSQRKPWLSFQQKRDRWVYHIRSGIYQKLTLGFRVGIGVEEHFQVVVVISEAVAGLQELLPSPLDLRIISRLHSHALALGAVGRAVRRNSGQDKFEGSGVQYARSDVYRSEL